MRSARNVAAGIVFALSVLVAPGAAAQDHAPWVVLESRGQVAQAAADGAALSLTPGATLREDRPVTTGVDGALVIAHGKDRVTVSNNSAFSIPAGIDPATGPSILQTLGTLLFKVEHTPGRRFEVETPYLAAVVKGTVFTVGVDGPAQVVHVAQGAVEVTVLGSHDATLVRPGETATLSLPTGTLSVGGSRHSSATPESGDGNPAPGNVAATGARARGTLAAPAPSAGGATRITRTLGDAPLDVAAVTNGLVRGSAPAPSSTPPSLDPAAEVGPSGIGVTAGTPAPSVSVSAGASATAAASAGPSVVGGSINLLHNSNSAAATALLPGSNSPAVTGRKP